MVADLKNLVISLDGRVKSLEGGKPAAVSAPKVSKKEEDDDDDGVDLFGSDSEVVFLVSKIENDLSFSFTSLFCSVNLSSG